MYQFSFQRILLENINVLPKNRMILVEFQVSCVSFTNSMISYLSARILNYNGTRMRLAKSKEVYISQLFLNQTTGCTVLTMTRSGREAQMDAPIDEILIMINSENRSGWIQ